jgi:hypothetical protein
VIAWIKLAALAGAVVLLVSCTGPFLPVRWVPRGATGDGLHRVQSKEVDAAFLRPGARFGGYHALLIDPVRVSHKTEPRPPRGSVALDPAAMERVKGIFRSCLDRELVQSGDFSIASEPGPGVLRVSGQIVDLVVDAIPNRIGERYYVTDTGEMTLALDARDSVTGEPLARVVDRRAIRPAGAGLGDLYLSSTVRNWGAMEDVFCEWAEILRAGLDELRELSAVPAGPSAN